jgi:hypothetical protein
MLSQEEHFKKPLNYLSNQLNGLRIIGSGN